MREIYDKERQVFQADRNLGLIQQAALRAPRWVLKRLTGTYVTLHLSDIGKVVKMDGEEEVRALLLSMVGFSLILFVFRLRKFGFFDECLQDVSLAPHQIESSDITAQIDVNGTVTFSDPPAQFTKEQVDGVLRDVQEQTALLVYLEQEVGRSKEYLSKVGVFFFLLLLFRLCFILFLFRHPSYPLFGFRDVAFLND